MSFKGLPTQLSDLIADSITGALIETAASGPRIVLTSADVDTMLGYTGDPNETAPASLTMGRAHYAIVGQPPTLFTRLTSPTEGPNQPAFLELHMNGAAGAETSTAQLVADAIEMRDADTFGGILFGSLAYGLESFVEHVFAGGIQVGNGGAPGTGTKINAIQVDGSQVGNAATNGSGQNTYNHTLGVVPALVLVVSRTSGLIPLWISATTTTFTMEWINPTTGAVAVGFNPTIGFLAIA